MLSAYEAAERCGVSDDTIRRLLKKGQFPNATRAADGQTWQIPLTDLVVAGLSPRIDVNQARQLAEAAQADAHRISRLEAEISTLRERVARAEALAVERSDMVERLLAALGARRTVHGITDDC